MIYTTAKVTIKNYQAKIDRPIILYRGDRNVEIQFEIVETIRGQYNAEGSNIIMNLNARYGQLVVLKPDLSYVISDMSETQDGKVIFMIPGDLIDETSEVGKYNFQIRLFDETLNSRVTLPPVTEGIDIVEPIASEDKNE